MPSVFDDLIREISDRHGPTTYHPQGNGAAINVDISRGDARNRNYYFQIYNNAAYGSRTTPPPNRPGRTIYTVRLRGPQDTRLQIDFREYAVLCSQRTLPNDNIRTVTDTGGRPILQVCSKALYILFDLERAVDPVVHLRRLYETFVLPLNVAIEDQPLQVYHVPGLTNATLTVERTNRRGGGGGGTTRRRGFWTEGAQRREYVNPVYGGETPQPAPEPPPPPPPPPPTDKGEKWDVHGVMIPLPSVDRDPQEALLEVRKLRYRHLDTQLTQADRALVEAQNYYQDMLEAYHQAKRAMEEAEDRVRVLREMKRLREEGEVVEDEDMAALMAIIRSHYEKVWFHNEDIWALTKPIVISQTSRSARNRDNFRTLAGRFYVKVQAKSGRVAYYREDGRVALNGRGSSKVVAPHCINGTQQCWGTYGPLLSRCQEAGDIGQILLLTVQHIGSATLNDGYMPLRLYAGNLNLPSTEDPEYDFFANAQPENPEPDNTIIEAGDLTPEEMALFGLNGGQPQEDRFQPEPHPEVAQEEDPGDSETLQVHDDYLDDELVGDEIP